MGCSKQPKYNMEIKSYRKLKNKLLRSFCRNCPSLRFRNLDNESSYVEKNVWNTYEDAKGY